MATRKILLVIDPQMAYADDGAFPVFGFEETIERIGVLMDKWDGDVHLFQHDKPDSPFAVGSPGFALHPSIVSRQARAASVSVKNFPSAFTGTDLADYLVGGVEIFVCGYMATHCVLATFMDAIAASSLPPVIISDAIGSPDLGAVGASLLVRSALATAASVYGRIATVGEVLGLDPHG